MKAALSQSSTCIQTIYSLRACPHSHQLTIFIVAVVTALCSWFLIGVDRGEISKCCYYGEQEDDFIF